MLGDDAGAEDRGLGEREGEGDGDGDGVSGDLSEQACTFTETLIPRAQLFEKLLMK